MRTVLVMVHTEFTLPILGLSTIDKSMWKPDFDYTHTKEDIK